MLSLHPGVRIFISTEPVDLRKGFDVSRRSSNTNGTAIRSPAICSSSRIGDGTLLKLLYWDNRTAMRSGTSGSRRERSEFPAPTKEGRIELTAAKLAMLLEGIDFRHTRKRTRYRHRHPEIISQKTGRVSGKRGCQTRRMST